VLIAQITDTHIKPEGSLAYDRVDTSAFLARAVDHILHLDPRPDVVLGTSDLVDGGTPAEYARLRHLLSPLPMPIYLIPGNHDDREALRQVFADYPKMPRAGFIQYVVEDGPLRLIAVDTLLPGTSGGRVDAERLRRLDARLAEAPAKPTMIFMHHPPFKTAIEYMDGIGLEGADAMAEVVRSSAVVVPKVRTCWTRSPLMPGTRTQAVTLFLCTSRPAHRSSTCSMATPPGESDAGARRSVRVTTLLGVLAATMRGAGSSPVSLCADSRYLWRRRRIRALGSGRIAHFHAAG
jgi:3',5'-cyclic AMP phosphodiesterase CpdA